MSYATLESKIRQLIEKAQSGGNDELLKGIIERTATEVVIPEGVTNIGNYAFYRLSALTNVSLPNGLETIGLSAFERSGISSIQMPDTVTTLDGNAFSSCNKLETVSFSSNVSSIPYNCFFSCAKLVLNSLPEGITQIHASAFANCHSVTEMTFPASLQTFVSGNHFGKCTALEKVTFKTNPGALAGSVFDGCTSLLTIRVPWAEGEVANAPWGATNATIIYNYTGE